MNAALLNEKPTASSRADSRRRLIRRARQAKGLTQRELGQRLGLPQSTVSQIETGDLQPKPDMLPRIAAELEIGGHALQDFLADESNQHWRAWIWQSRRSPSQKLVLLALLEREETGGDLDSLQERTALTVGTLRAVIAELVDDGLVTQERNRNGQLEQLALAMQPQQVDQ